MFKIYDGREHFYQWDVDRKLIIEDAAITQVHFCNRTGECSLVCETYQENGLTLVNVPNILLQTDWRINVYAYDTNYTKFSETYDVVRRSKPDNYVYTETEVLNYNTLLDRMNEVDANIANSVEDYLERNPVDVDLTGYATEQYVAAAINEIELTPGPQGEPGVYVGTEEPTDDSLIWINPEGESSSNVATKEYVDEAVANAGGGGGIPTYYFSSTNKDWTDEMKAQAVELYSYYVANGTLPECEIVFVEPDSCHKYYTTEMYASSGAITCRYLKDSDFYTCLISFYTSDGSFRNGQHNFGSIPNPHWEWVEDSWLSLAAHGNAKHFKLVGYIASDSSKILTVEFNTTHNNGFSEESGTWYAVPTTGFVTNEKCFYLQNDGNTVTLTDPTYQTSPHSDVTWLGYYVWLES